MEEEPRMISQDYLNRFIQQIKDGARIVYVQGSNYLAVEHPTEQYLILQLKDKVVPNG